ncbi:MAG TPA: hypothetical protein VMX16_10730 [Terriglobia bacterium]|nr:hypothetical protein [Terriglobia bacterium]
MKRTRWIHLVLIAGLLAVLGSRAAVAGQVTIGPSSQDVLLTSTGLGTINVTFGSCAGTTCTLTNSGGTAYTLTTTFATTSLLFTYSGVGEDFNPVSNSFTANVGGSGSQPASYTLAFSDGHVDFDGTWLPGGFSFDYSLNALMGAPGNLGPGPATNAILTSLAADPAGTAWEATISSGEFNTPEASSAFLLLIMLGGVGLTLRKRERFA